MFDFMKDLYFEMNGFDMEMIKEEKRKKLEREKAETIIFKKKTKIIIMITGFLFLAISIAALIISVQQTNISGIIKNIINIFLDVVTVVCLMIKKKQTEVASLFLIALIIIITFVLPIV